MGWLERFKLEGGRLSRRPHLPRHLLRHVIHAGGLTVGSRVLLAGEKRAEWAALLGSLGMEAIERDSLGNISEFPTGGVDLVLVDARADQTFNNDPQETAELLSRLRPAGRLIVLSQSRATFNAETNRTTSLADVLAALSQFRGSWTSRQFPAGPFHRQTWGWALGLQPRPGYWTATMQIPKTPISRSQWQQRAEEIEASAKPLHPERQRPAGHRPAA